MAELISVLTPVYNGQATLCDAVRSVFAQTYSHWEMLIVSDDGVDYEPLLRAQGLVDSRVTFLSTPSHRSGPNVGRNVALAKAQGDWIAPLDADDVYYPQRLERLLDAAAMSGLSLDNAKIVGQHIESRIVLSDKAVNNWGFDEFVRSLVPLLFLFHREHIHCGWDEDIVRGADTIFNLRALERAGSAGFIEEALHEYRVHDKSMCHAEGAESLFEEAYQHTLDRLNGDGLGFQGDGFRQRVIRMIADKQKINRAFSSAVRDGYSGNYQSFVEEYEIC